MSSGNITTEYTKQEMATEAAILRASALVNNAVLRRALAIAAYEQAVRDKGQFACADAGIALMITWIMRASEEIESASGQGSGVRDQLAVNCEVA